MMDLLELENYNARLLAGWSLGAPNREKSIITTMSLGLVLDEGKSIPRPFSCAVLFEGEGKNVEKAISKFIGDFGNEIALGSYTLNGRFQFSRAAEERGRGLLEITGEVIVSLEKITLSFSSGTHTIINEYQEVPVTLTFPEAGSFNDISVNGAVTIHEDGRILKPDDTNGSILVTLTKFARLKHGTNVITTTGVTLEYRPRL